MREGDGEGRERGREGSEEREADGGVRAGESILSSPFSLPPLPTAFF